MELEWQGLERWFAGIPKLIGLAKKLLKAEHNEKLIEAVDHFLRGFLFARVFAFSRAEIEFHECLEIAEPLLGERHLLAAVYLFLAETQVGADKDKEAEESYEKACSLIKKTVGYQHQLTPLVVNSYAGFMTGKGRLPDAKKLFKEALTAQEKRFGPNHFFLARAKMTYAKFLGKQGLYVEQAKMAREALEIFNHQDCPPRVREKNCSQCKQIVEEADRKANSTGN